MPSSWNNSWGALISCSIILQSSADVALATMVTIVDTMTIMFAIITLSIIAAAVAVDLRSTTEARCRC